MDIIRYIASTDKICVFIVIYDFNLTIRYCNYFLLIKGNQVYSLGSAETVNCKLIREVYGMDAAIFAAIPPLPRCLSLNHAAE